MTRMMLTIFEFEYASGNLCHFSWLSLNNALYRLRLTERYMTPLVGQLGRSLRSSSSGPLHIIINRGSN